ncbi:MlaD family protein [Mycobacteroides abscessus]|uniref:MlaD family protein n=1 Tax=Mycobacteroides abscessus TaxID=36809 RepID=UPI00078D97AF|nr:MlaD family protein [Mycobacteroides abscessus]AMU77045.1 mammalian cell entry protein [Mycobacteroides abscessus]ANO25991.1 mammalian cell entry protein [Mycobacteroides abscessus]MBN7320488.1 MCE family protein [Mycobacteroides abscessus subsp. massiliense]
MMRRVLTLLLTAALAVVPACSSEALDPTKMPMPGAYIPKDTYRVKIEFSSVLNLPGRAKVDSGGVQVGLLDRVELKGTTPVVYVDIDGGAKFPKNVKAELRQATVLGDIYIAMISPANPVPAQLQNGDTIALADTVPAANVEDLMRSMSNLIGGGSLNTMQTTVANMNSAFPPPEELDRIHRALAGIINDLSNNQDTINKILTNMQTISETFRANKGTYRRLLTEGPTKLPSLAKVVLSLSDLIIYGAEFGRQISQILDYPNLMQILSYLTPFIHSASTADTTIPVLGDKMVRTIRDRIIPFFKDGGPKYTVTDIQTPDGTLGVSPGERADSVIRNMQTMGLVR